MTPSEYSTGNYEHKSRAGPREGGHEREKIVAGTRKRETCMKSTTKFILHIYTIARLNSKRNLGRDPSNIGAEVQKGGSCDLGETLAPGLVNRLNPGCLPTPKLHLQWSQEWNVPFSCTFARALARSGSRIARSGVHVRPSCQFQSTDVPRLRAPSPPLRLS